MDHRQPEESHPEQLPATTAQLRTAEDQERFEALDPAKKQEFLTELQKAVEDGLGDEEAMRRAFREVETEPYEERG